MPSAPTPHKERSHFFFLKRERMRRDAGHQETVYGHEVPDPARQRAFPPTQSQAPTRGRWVRRGNPSRALARARCPPRELAQCTRKLLRPAAAMTVARNAPHTCSYIGAPDLSAPVPSARSESFTPPLGGIQVRAQVLSTRNRGFRIPPAVRAPRRWSTRSPCLGIARHRERVRHWIRPECSDAFSPRNLQCFTAVKRTERDYERNESEAKTFDLRLRFTEPVLLWAEKKATQKSPPCMRFQPKLRLN